MLAPSDMWAARHGAADTWREVRSSMAIMALVYYGNRSLRLMLAEAIYQMAAAFTPDGRFDDDRWHGASFLSQS